MCREAVDAIKALDVAGASCSNLITFVGTPPRVVAEFDTVDEARMFHNALIRCGEVARFIEAIEQADSSR